MLRSLGSPHYSVKTNNFFQNLLEPLELYPSWNYEPLELYPSWNYKPLEFYKIRIIWLRDRVNVSAITLRETI